LAKVRILLVLCIISLAACGRAPPPAPALSPASESVRQEVEQAVVERFGAAALARARSADEFIAVLRYPGLPMPPHDTDGHPIKPSYPTGLLFREKGQWFAYGMGGLHPMLPRWSEQLERSVRDPRLWAEPPDGGVVGCTDAGASYAWLRIAGHPEHARIGHCGGSPLTEQLVATALMG
jgi:hypothetical protein